MAEGCRVSLLEVEEFRWTVAVCTQWGRETISSGGQFAETPGPGILGASVLGVPLPLQSQISGLCPACQ